MADDHWEEIDAAVPLLLLPVRIETRADGDTLRVRIYPDDVHVDVFDERLTDDEVLAGKQYWQARWPVNPPGGAADPWATLVGVVGTRRAGWVATSLTPTNLTGRPTEVPVFPEPPTGEPVHRPRARLLPDCLRVVLQQGAETATATGELIDPEGVVLGPRVDRPRADQDAPDDELRRAVDLLRGQPGTEPDPALVWLVDYKEAETAGMAVTVPLPDPHQRIDRLYVIGVRTRDEPQTSADAFAELIRAHAFSDGLAFIPMGTATNNTEAARSAWSRAAEMPGQPSIETPTAAGVSDAEVVAAALGIAPDALAGVQGSTQTGQWAAGAFATALWPVTWGPFLDKTLVPTASGGAVPDSNREAVREHAITHVRGRGPLPALRIGKQPYGFLPVTGHGASWQPVEGGPVDEGLAGLLNRLRPLWQLAAEDVPTVTSGDIEKDLPKILGQLPVSRAIRVRTALTEEASTPIAPGLNIRDNVMTQGILAAALTQLIGGQPGLWVAPDMLSKTARNLALPLAHESDPVFCEAIIGVRDWAEPLSVLQALLGLADAAARHEWEEYIDPDRLEVLKAWLSRATNILDDETINLGIAALQRMGDRAYDDLDLYRDAADLIERATQPFNRTRYLARFPLAALRPHPVAAARTDIERVQVVAAALRMAQRYAEFRVAVLTIGSVEELRDRALLLAETLDCASHRLDAWLTSLATRRLRSARADGVRGLTIGAFGWLENIDIRPPTTLPDDPDIYQAPGDGGFVLAPSQTHAATAAVLKGARLTHDPGDTGDAALDIDLSSTRVRAALSIVDGMRSGQSLGALLGYRLERWIHQKVLFDADGDPIHFDKYIYCLRSIAPLTAAKSTDRTTGAVDGSLESVATSEVVDGVRLLELYRVNRAAIGARLAAPPPAYMQYFDGGAWPTTVDEQDVVLDLVEQLDRLHDAVADLLLAESVHQLVSGAPARSAAAMDALAGDGLPPDPDVVHSPRSGVALTHRVGMLFSDSPLDDDSGWTDDGRGLVHPMLEQWARDALGNADRVVLATPPGDPAVTLADANICALDLIASAGPEPLNFNGAQRFWSLLTRRVPALADVPLPGLDRPPGLPADALTFAEIWALAGSVRQLLTGARAATTADLARATDAGADTLTAPAGARNIDRVDLRKRAASAVNALRVAAQAGGGAVGRADALAIFGLGASVDPAELTVEELAAHAAALTTAADTRVRAAEAALAAYDANLSATDRACLAALAEVVQTVYDDRQPLAPVLLSTGADDPFVAAVRSGVTVTAEGRTISDGRDARPWLTRYARVRPAVGRFAEVLLLREALGNRRTLRVAQLADRAFGTWIGLPFPDGSGPPSSPITGYVLDVAEPPESSSNLCGVIVDDWSEVVPSRTEIRDPVSGEPTGDTQETTTVGLAVNANGPNARAPQTLLLAVSPDGGAWSADKVVRVLADTQALARERAIALEQVPMVGRLLPAIYVQDWSLQGEPVLDTQFLLTTSHVQAALLTHVVEKD